MQGLGLSQADDASDTLDETPSLDRTGTSEVGASTFELEVSSTVDASSKVDASVPKVARGLQGEGGPLRGVGGADGQEKSGWRADGARKRAVDMNGGREVGGWRVVEVGRPKHQLVSKGDEAHEGGKCEEGRDLYGSGRMQASASKGGSVGRQDSAERGEGFSGVEYAPIWAPGPARIGRVTETSAALSAPSTPSPEHERINPKPWTLDPEHRTWVPGPWTFIPRFWTLDPES